MHVLTILVKDRQGDTQAMVASPGRSVLLSATNVGDLTIMKGGAVLDGMIGKQGRTPTAEPEHTDDGDGECAGPLLNRSDLPRFRLRAEG